MLICDDEPSPVSSDEVFFICADEQTTPISTPTTTKTIIKNDDNNDNIKIKKILINDKFKNNSMLKIDSIDDVKQQQQKQKKLKSIFSRKKK